eukprot:7595629-Prorocentrum_lima.AAC.1
MDGMPRPRVLHGARRVRLWMIVMVSVWSGRTLGASLSQGCGGSSGSVVLRLFRRCDLWKVPPTPSQ